jgi:hypothetical protein
MTQEQMPDDWKARQENLDAIGCDFTVTSPQVAIDLDVTAQTIFELFGTLPLDRAVALLEELRESIEDDECDRTSPIDDNWQKEQRLEPLNLK